MSERQGWTPNFGEQRVLWWSRFTLRWIGAGGLIYTALITHDPLGMLMFTITGMGIDVGTLVATLIRIGRDEARELEDSLKKHDMEREQYHDPSKG